ncbi:hypothetical protein [Streptomyces griseosporeus]|uniref:hypothetical protein n=1 Tax=Streptomyces griseosporeus TaxID=1910 RepID=UPI00378C2A74
MTQPPQGFGPAVPQYGQQYGVQHGQQYGVQNGQQHGFPPPPPPHPPTPQGPEFVAVDTRNAIAVDAEGVTLDMNGVQAEFPWPEVRSVHYRASPNGKALMLGVIHLDGHFYEAVVDARPKARLTEWFAQLAWVLRHYRPTG